MIDCLVLLLVAMNSGEVFSLDHAVVLRPVTVEERQTFAALPTLALINAEPKKELLKLAEQAKKSRLAVRSEKTLFLLAAGPMLDGPDRVEVHELKTQNEAVTLRVWHTSARASGTKLRQNIQWRPLVQVPIELSPGKWKIVAEWSPRASLPDGKAMGNPTAYSQQVEVLPAASR
jgi:hypothetical protein